MKRININLRSLIIPVIAMFILQGCGVRYMIRNEVYIPKRAGKYPRFKEKDRLSGGLSKYRTCYDVYYYNLNIDVDIDNHYLRGYIDIYLTALQDFDTVQVDLFKKMKINKITYNNNELEFTRKHNAIFVYFPGIQAGENLTFRIAYEGEPIKAKRPPWQGGFVWKTDKDGKPFIGVTCEGMGASSWWPTKDHPSDEPDSMRINITVPPDLFGVSNGKLRETSITPDGKKAFTWFVGNPINGYNVSVYIGNYVAIIDTLQDGSVIRNLEYYVLEYNQEVAWEHFKQVKDVIRFYENIYGEYPWWDDNYKLVEAPYVGMEHQSAIAYGHGYVNTSRRYNIYGLVDYIILHETAHEWWGNSVTACDGADIWIHESFATYSEVLYVEHKLGYLMSLDYLMKKRRFIRNKRPIVGPRNVGYWGFDDVYWKGAWVLHTLRNVVDDDSVFFDIIKTFATRYAKQVVCTEDFIRLVNEKTGEDYQYFFDQYLYDRAPPVIEYFQDENSWYYRWSQVQKNFTMPLDIRINKKTIRIFPTLETQKLTVSRHALVEINDGHFYVAQRENVDLISSE